MPTKTDKRAEKVKKKDYFCISDDKKQLGTI